jgi:hypothetical protein
MEKIQPAQRSRQRLDHKYYAEVTAGGQPADTSQGAAPFGTTELVGTDVLTVRMRSLVPNS